MGFLNALKIKAEELTRKTAEETSKFVEKTKNSLAITELEDKIKKLYITIGEQLYTANAQETEIPDFSELFSQIDEYKEKVNELREENDQLKK